MKRFVCFLVAAVFVGILSAAQVKNVAVVETDVDVQSGVSAELTASDVRLVTAVLRKEATKNLPRGKYNIMTSETVYAQGSAVLEECVDENCVIALGSKIGADYIVRGIISKLETMFTLSVEIYETENGNLVDASDLIRSRNIAELIEKAEVVCANMYRTFANLPNQASVAQGYPLQSITYTITTVANPTNGGYVSRNPNQTNYAPKTRVSLMAVPTDGCTFIGWSGAAKGTTNPITITVDNDKMLTANFQQPYTLTTYVFPSDGGYVSFSPNKEAYAAGEKVIITAISAEGYAFTGWTGAVSGRKNRLTVTMDGNKVLSANFYQKTIQSSGVPRQEKERVRKPKSQKTPGYGFGGFFVSDFGGGIMWNESNQRVVMPYNGGGAHMFCDFIYIEVVGSLSWGEGKWQSTNATDQNDLPNMFRNYISAGIFAKYPFDAGSYVKLSPLLGIDYDWSGTVFDSTTENTSVKLNYVGGNKYLFDGKEGRPARNAMNALWGKAGLGIDLGNNEIFMRMEALYGVRMANAFEKSGVEKEKRNGRDAMAIPGRGLTLRLALGICPTK